MISGPSLNPLMTVHSGHTWKKSKCHFSVSGRTTKDNVSAPQGLCICSQCDQRTFCERLLSFVREANFTATGAPHMIKMPNSSRLLTIHTEGKAVLQNTPMCLAPVQVYTFVNSHKARWSICIKSLHMVQVFVLI